ncbi:MAG: hypothetical protein AB7E84_16530 [Xanthobacteraceae bacterium]
MKIIVGSFPAEQSWSEPGAPKLSPFRLPDMATRSLDEMLFPLCEDEDVLCTRLHRHATMSKYHTSLGFRHVERACTDDTLDPRETYVLLGDEMHEAWLARAILSGAQLTPWAVTHESAALFARQGLRVHPSADIAARVNSKVWSTELRKRTNDRYPCVVTSTWEELLSLGRDYLERYGVIVIKEPFGVSGSGTTRVDSERRLLNLIKTLSSREGADNVAQMIVEPFLNRAFDFSTYLDIKPDGRVHRLGVQEILVSGFSWSAIMPMSAEHERSALTPTYFAVVDDACRALFEDGYHGPVCIDSMVLTNDDVVPIIEINARLSVGRVNQHLDKALAAYDCRSYLSVVRTSLNYNQIDDLFDALRATGALFEVDHNEGILPLTSNTLRSDVQDETPGRMYYAVAFRHICAIQRYKELLRAALELLGARIF